VTEREDRLTDTDSALLRVVDLRTYFHTFEGVLRAVDGVTFAVSPNRNLGLIGESGCGKSVTALSILQIQSKPGRIDGGAVLWRARDDSGAESMIDLAAMKPDSQALRMIRGNEISMVFQEPMTCFSPYYTIGNQIREAILVHTRLRQDSQTRAQAEERSIEMLARVAIPNPRKTYGMYPHELSGGMRQRAMIAMALVGKPRLLIADEPTTALDVTTQAQILELIGELQAEFGLTVMIISHDIAVVSEISLDVAVMYLGRIVESGAAKTIFTRAMHPYTRALIMSLPRLARQAPKLQPVSGNVPSLFNVPRGCAFHPRCPHLMRGTCDGEQRPELREVEPGHFVRCLLFERGVR
jgi:peptide/nickel transport system ATP-binding protein